MHVPQAEDDMGDYTRKMNSSSRYRSHSQSGSNSLLSIYSPSAGDIESNVQNVFTRGTGGEERQGPSAVKCRRGRLSVFQLPPGWGLG